MNPTDLLLTNQFKKEQDELTEYLKDELNQYERVPRLDLTTRYRKNISSYLNVDSRQRNIDKYPNPANYNIYINKEFKYIQSITLTSIECRESLTPINENNNSITWITDYNGLLGIYDKVQYSTIIPSSFYTLDSFIQTVESSMNSIQHTISYLDGLYHTFSLYINKSKALTLMERLEMLEIDTLTTTINSNEIKITINNPSPPSNNCMDNEGEGYPFKPDFEDVPIIMTGLPLKEYGNIPSVILDSVPFYATESNISYYTCQGYTTVFNYTLHAYDKCGNPAKASYTKTYDMKNGPVIGRLLKVEILTNNISTFGNYLGLLTTGSVYLNTNYTPQIVINKLPWKMLPSGELSLSTNEYIFMRIGTISKPFETISDNLTDASGNKSESNNYFAKIIFSDRDPGDVSIVSVGGNKIFYDAPFVSLSDLSIQFLSGGKIMKLFQNHSFTLEIVELREVLNDTLIDSRTGNNVDIGKFT